MHILGAIGERSMMMRVTVSKPIHEFPVRSHALHTHTHIGTKALTHLHTHGSHPNQIPCIHSVRPHLGVHLKDIQSIPSSQFRLLSSPARMANTNLLRHPQKMIPRIDLKAVQHVFNCNFASDTTQNTHQGYSRYISELEDFQRTIHLRTGIIQMKNSHQTPAKEKQ